MNDDNRNYINNNERNYRNNDIRNPINIDNRIKFNNDDNNDTIKKEKKLVDKLDEIQLTQDMIDNAETKQCSICLDEYSINDKISYLPCFHFYHSLCIKNWLEKSKKCPLCNSDVVIK